MSQGIVNEIRNQAEGCLRGEEAAKTAFVQSIVKLAWPTICRRIKGRENQEEVLQEICIFMVAQADKFVDGTIYAPEGWVREKCVYLCLDHYKKKGPPRVSLTGDMELATKDDPARSIEYQELLEGCLADLTPIERAVVDARIEGKTLQEIAEVYKVNRGTVSRWLDNIREKTRRFSPVSYGDEGEESYE